MRKGAKFAKISIAKINLARIYPVLINTHKVSIEIDSDKWSKLSDEIVEIIHKVQSSDEPVSTFNQLSLTCSRFSALLQRKSHYLLPRVHLQFTEKDYKVISLLLFIVFSIVYFPIIYSIFSYYI